MKEMRASQSSQTQEPRGFTLFALYALSLIARLWTRTLRMDIDEKTLAVLHANRATVFTLWHNRLFTISEIYRRHRRNVGRQMYGLISSSKDGGLLAAFFRLMGIRAIRGSSRKGAVAALRSLVKVVAEGNDIGLTPDGPLGPCYTFHPGALLVMKRTDAAIVLFGFQFTRAWRMSSWDRIFIPYPFSRIFVTSFSFDSYDAFLKAVPSGVEPADFLKERLLEINPDECVTKA